MASVSTLNPGEPTRPVSRLDALRQELIKAQRTSPTHPSTQGHESDTPNTTDRRRESSGGRDPLDIDDIESDDGEWEPDIGPQNIPALAFALWDLKRRVDKLERHFDDHASHHASHNHDMGQVVGDISHRSASGRSTKVARGKRRKDDERA